MGLHSLGYFGFRGGEYQTVDLFRAGIQQRRASLQQRRSGGHHIINEQDVTPRALLSRSERAFHIRLSHVRIEPNLRTR